MDGLDSVLIKSNKHVSVGVKLDGTDNDSRYVERPLSSTRYYMADPTQ